MIHPFYEICRDQKRVDDYLRSLGIGTIPFCNNCQVGMRERADRHGIFKCNHCKVSVNGFKDTFFEDCRKGRGVFLFAIHAWIRGFTPSQMETECNISNRTVTTWTKLFRDVIMWDLQRDMNAQVIGGDDVIVEIDESKFGKRKHHRGHRVEGTWVVGGVERTPERRMFVEVVQDRSAATLMDIIQRHVAPGSQVYTDCWKGYRTDGLLDLEMIHATVNHSLHFKDPETMVHTNTIEGTWAGMKRKILPRYYSDDVIEPHLCEFIWRRLHEEHPLRDFLHALRDCYGKN